MENNDDLESQRRREECERKARRGEMDPRLEFAFQMLIDGTGLPRHQIMDHIFEGDMLDEINLLFQPNMRSKLLWFYQEVDEPEAVPVPEVPKPGPSRAAASNTSKTPQGVSPTGPAVKHKLFLTDGWTCEFKGICIYMFRINTTKQLPEEGFQKDLFCGVIDANRIGLVASIERIVEYVFMQALAYPNPETEDDDVGCSLIKGQLLPGLRSFCSALRVCEQVCEHINVFDDDKPMFVKIDNMNEVKDLAKNKEFCGQLEERVVEWIKGIIKVLMESEQLRKENDTSGPQDELEYWKRRAAQFSQLLAHMQDKEVQFTLHCLIASGSKIIRYWKDTDRKITFCYNEARDNSKFIQAMETCCHSLYLDDPVNMKESILSLLQTVRLIYSVSKFYNTSERTSSLMVKITNQMIETCKSYITLRCKETIWSQDRNVVRTKLTNCIKLNHIYRETYYSVREQPFLPNQTPFGFSENFVFGKFDTFCDRLSKILSMFNLIDDYNHLFARRLEGLLLGEALEEAMIAFDDAKKGILSKKYDYLDHRNADFNNDYQLFMDKTDALKESVGSMIESNFDSVWETPQCIRFLVRFEKVSQKIPLTMMDIKYQRILKYSEKDVQRILSLFRKQRDDPPLPRNFPPICGRIKWCRSLASHIEELISSVTSHPVLKTLPATKDLENKYYSVRNILKEYEEEIVNIWLDQDVAVADACLVQPILVLQNDKLVVNLHTTIPLLIREAKCLAKLDIELPIVAATLMVKQSHFHTIQDSLNDLIKMFLTTVKQVKLEVRPLFLPQLVQLTSMLKPGLYSICWTNPKWMDFYEKCKGAIETFNILVIRVHDIYSNRILNVLMSMQDVCLQSLPGDDEIWTVEEFLEKNEETCRLAALELNRKSQMVSEAVEEVLNLVQNATQTFKTMIGTENDPLTQDEIKTNSPQNKEPEVDGSGNQSQDWSILWSCFENPLSLLSASNGLPKGMQDMVTNAVSEMRRYYSRKVIDVLMKVTRSSLDVLRRVFVQDIVDTNATTSPPSRKPVFLLHSTLMIPNISIRPNLNELQEALIAAGKNMTGVSKGVAQWTSGKESSVQNPRPSRHNQNDAKSRRRKIYCLQSEERPQIPHMTKSFFSYIMENKEVVKTLNLLANCTTNLKIEVQNFVKRWKPYNFLWKNERTTRELMEYSLQDFESSLRYLAELDANLLVEPDMAYFCQCIAVSTEKLKFGLTIEIKSCTHKIGQAMKKKYKREMDYVYAVINEMDRKLDRTIRDLDDVRMIMDTLGKIREQEVDMELRIDPIEEAFNILTRYDIQVEREQFDQVDNLRYTFLQLQSRALNAQVQLLEMQPTFESELRKNLENFKSDKIEYVHEYRNAGPMSSGLTPREASDKLILFQNRFEGLWRRLQTYQSGEELFGLPQTDYPELGQIRKELNLLQKLYKLYNDVIDRVSSYYDIPWGEVDIEEINNELMEFQNRCRKLPKGLKEWPAFHALKRTIDDFNDMCPLLELMANKAMKPRHWQRIMEVTKYTFEFDSEGFSLKNILEAPLLKYKEDIEDICISAMKEKDIEAKLKQVVNEWSVQELQFMTFNNRGELLLRGDTTAETIGQLEDSLMVLGSLLSNRYNAPFRKQIQQWVYDLSNSNDILERWLLVQNMWVYLEAVFVGGDIAKQLPKEAKRFSKIDKSWQKIMQRAHETPGVVACCVGDDLLKQLLPHLQEQLELCQKSLSGYLERKRMMFPRFFFVSDPALLEILGQASDSHTIQNHLLSIFDNTRHVKFHDIEYNKMLAVVSSEGEVIPLDRAIRAEGSVETWLTSLLVSSQQSLHSIIRTAFANVNDPNFNLVPFLEKMPAQIGLLGIQMIWTRDAELALIQARQEKKVMGETNNKFLELLNTLIDQTTRDLTKIERIKFETLITIHVHQRDIFDILVRMGIRSALDFEWLKQCRFYFKEDLDKTLVSITDVNFIYQNEYLGCTDRLVITPLTDRCYITLAQALTLSMGGSPCGPAGTGKTETVKDMGKTLAKYVVVFNCSDQMDYRGLGRIYKGLAQSGTWGCFDEFNRIELPVLSVAAQQVAVVLTARKEKKKSFIFTDGDHIDLNPEFGIFITMNPGYAGRKELPENLKIQFRTVAMMVPDRQIIIRVKLASCGFLENITLARKFYTLYKLCEEQLTKQVHYDFGLRNILSVLRTLGASKRQNSKDSESTIVMRVLRDMNLSKLIDDDEPLFISLVADLFPNQSIEKTVYSDLEAAIAQKAEESGLVYHPPWVLKLIQLYETQKVRHGIMALGPSGAGKSTCIHTLMKALTQMGDAHREMRMNPKAITAAQMFGKLDVATNDWTDGIFSALWRKTLKMKNGEHIWLVLDGPVDSIWIENLNSVLDDNKTLTLANGDRLSMSPTCKIIFEPHNIDNASPATVSRNGMVYMSSSGLDWKPILCAWLKSRSPRENAVLQDLFDQSFGILYSWETQNLQLKMDVLQCNIIQQMLFILEGLVPLPKDETPNVAVSVHESVDEEAQDDQQVEVKEELYSPEHIHRLYIFALTWSFGALLNTTDRVKLDQFVKEKFTHFDFPKHDSFPDSTIFDFFVATTGVWEHWRTLVTNYAYPENATPDYLSILIPIIDNVRLDYLIKTIANQERAVLIIGEQGTGKTVMVKNFMKKTNPETTMGRSFNFSSATSPYQFQKTMENYVEKRLGNTFGPPGGRKMIVFIDDINMPQINCWGDQITNEIVRQSMDMKGFYSLEKPGDFTSIVDVQYVAAMGLPGGGRNDIPSRLKRQFCVFNCNLPDNESIDKIFRVVGEGHYNAKRGFTPQVRGLIKKIIPVTRYLWQRTRNKLLPTPAKFHYVFNLRDLSRIWQGMVGTLSTVITSENVLISLWKHECTRVFSDRFTISADKEWFNTELLALIKEELGEAYVDMAKPNPVFVDFMRDAPEPTGEEGEDTDMELPKVYEPVLQYDVLRERLNMFLAQFNEMVRGSGMDLVFFPDAMLHLVKISRIIRHPRGNVMLIGVGGSGKQSLTKLASFIAGYKMFQISLTRSYNVGNFLEDLKLLYRSCGVQGKGTTFLFSDLDIKEDGFLEYLNNILSSGVIANLFNRDEQSEIVSELTPIMKRENQKKTANAETVMEYFMQRVCHNLHVAFCFSPVGDTFRNKVQRFPALVSGCTIDWFQPWPKDALVSVARHFLSEFQIECTDVVKNELVTALGTIQDIVAETSNDYFQRFRRATHVTPKSYLNFIAGYKNIYQMKQSELSGGVEKMDTGLEKLKDASVQVEILKKDLAVMEMDLAEASQKAESVLLEVTEKAMQAEVFKNQVQIVKEKAEALVAKIAEEKAFAEEKLEAAKPALEEAEEALNTIKPAHIATVRKLGRPPHLIMRIMDCVLILFQRKLHPCIADTSAPCPKPSWQEALKMMASTTFLLQLQNYPKDSINDEMIDFLQPYFYMEDYNMDMAKRVCGDVAGLLSWTKAMAFFHGVNKEVLPLKANLTLQAARLKVAMDDLAAAENQLAEREAALQEVKNQYDSAVGEKQRLTDAANICLRKMTAATALINGLQGEKHRWTQQSKDFKIQLGKLVGDVLLATGFLSYCGPYNQEFRANLLKCWMGILKTKQIPYTNNLNIINMLVESATVSEWTLQGLPNDELSVQNALIVTKSSSYPLLIDPQNQGKLWIKSKEDQNELQITSLNHKYFRTHLEDSLSLGRPLLIEDVGTELDPVIDNVLEKNFIKSGSIEKVLVGDKECDVMPGFMLYITTKLPNPPFSPEISAKTSIIDFTVTMRGLEDQLLGRVILMEKSDLEAERVTLFESVMKNQRSMKELEANLLSKLSSSEGSLVDDEELIDVLRETKTTAEEVNQKLKISEVTEKKITIAREEFRAVAARGSILYFLIVEMSNVNSMYQNSLKQFLVIFDNSITKSTKSNNTDERINIILRYLTYEVWVFTSRSLYERHKQLFTLMLAIKIDYNKGNITHDEFMAFVKGGASLDLNATYRPHPWRPMLDVEVVPLSNLPVTNAFVTPCYISHGMSTEPLRYPNFVTGLERNPQHAARTALNTRYTGSEWKIANDAMSNEVDCNSQQLKNLLNDTNQLLSTQNSHIGGQNASTFRIRDQIADSQNLCQQLNDELTKLIDELKLLSDVKCDLEKATEDLEIPLHIAQECLYHRECRYGIDKTHDNAELSLLKEIGNIRDSQSELKKLLGNVNIQLLDCRNMQSLLEDDIAHKESAISLDTVCEQLNNHSRGVNYYGEIERYDPTNCNREQWQQSTNSRLSNSKSDREKSNQLRVDAGVLINNVSKSVWDCWSMTNDNLSIRANELAETRNKVLTNLQETHKQIFIIEQEIEVILNDIRNKSVTMKVAQTRLEVRTHRPGSELCKDPVQDRLVEEVNDIKNAIQMMDKKLQDAKAQHQKLLKSRGNLETDLLSKVDALFIDREKCLGLRNSFSVAPKPFRWILDITWLNLVEISKLNTFSDVLKKIEQNERDWRLWYESEKPEAEEIPCSYSSTLDGFRKLLLIRSWSPDRTISQAKRYVEESLGSEYGEMQILDLEATWAESEPRTPLVCILSIGSDPTSQIGSLAKNKCIALKSVSMGQGQEFHARKMITEGMAGGGWVMLQNVHLSISFCSEIIDILVETEHIEDSFRLWVTTEVHEEFPIGLLQMAIKFTNEPPQGIRASMKRSYQAFSQDFLDYTAAAQWPPLLYTVAFLHTIVQERRKFGPLGWNVPYEFNQADFAASVQFVQNHLDEMDVKKGVSWPTVCYMLGEVMYGGRVTDDFDKRLLVTFTQVWFNENLLTSGFEFYKGYKVPITRNLQNYTDYINSLPATDTPEVFGLHSNADITYQINTAKGILDTILSVQPKEGGGGGGETRESIVYQLAEDMLRKLPPQYNAFEVREALNRMGSLLPMNIFFRQELDRMQCVIRQVHESLCDLKLAIDGTIVMSQYLRESLDAMYDARIPEKWMRISWESTTLGFWYTELLERNTQFRQWFMTDRPKVFWMTGFFNPQGFLTAMRQEVTRAHKGWALDSVVLQNQITKFNKEDINESPVEGVYVHGLFLEGASLDRRSGKLIESKPKVLYEQMSVIYIYAINTTAGKDPKLYECPIYRKPQRTDQKYVGSIDFETDFNPRHWTLRGVALLCDIK